MSEAATDRPSGTSARVHLLFVGYASDRVAGTVAYVRDGDVRLVIDPGMVPDRRVILEPLARIGETPESITDVVFSHHHLDHTLHAALFPNARFHDFRAIYQGDVLQRRSAEGFELSSSIRLILTPGHTPQDLTTLVGTAEGVYAFTHLWWMAEGPAEDPFAPDRDLLRANRERVLRVADTIVPGHGAPFTPGPDTPR